MQNLKELALVLLRVVLGITFIAHGWDKVFNTGVDGVTGFFTSLGIPAPALAAAFASYGELIFGILLVIGLATRVAALALTFNMAGAIFFAHRQDGFLSTDGAGFEFPLMLICALLVVAAFGSGRFGLDGLLFKKKAAK